MEYVFKSKPLAHQERTFHLSKDAEAWGILFEMGVGKSKVLTDTAAYLYSLGRINCWIVLAPNGVHKKWIKEDIPFSLPDHIEYKAAVWEAGNKKSMEACEDLFKPGPHLRILLANIEGLSYKKLPEFLERLLKSTDALLAVDESTRVKNPTSIRTKKLYALKKYTKYRRILAGDSVVNSPFDLFSQIGFLYDDVLGYSYPAFKAEYAEMLKPTDILVQNIMRKNNLRFPPQVPAVDALGNVKYKNLDKLKKLIEPFCTRYTKEECLDLPPKIYKTHYHALAPNQRKMYDQLAEEFKFELNGTTVPVLHKLTLSLRLQQMACGYISDIDGNMRPLFKNPEENPRIQLLLETLEDIEGPVIIWCRFQEDIRTIEKVLGEQVAVYYGGEVDAVCQANMELFKSGQRRYFVGTAQKGGIGLNLTIASTVIYYSNTFNAGDRWQSEDRAHRIGQTSDKVVYIDFQAEDTVDEKIIDALRKKKNLSNYMLELAGAGKPVV